MESSPALEAAVAEWGPKLAHVYDRITRGHVVISRPHHHQPHGQGIRVLIELSVPGAEIVVSHDHDLDPAQNNAYAAVRDAFIAARRQVQDHAQIARHEVKAHRTAN